MSREIKKTERGFGIYLDAADTYGARLHVSQSSADPLDKAWLFIQGGALSNNNGSAHLSREQAAALRDALTAWLADQDDLDAASPASAP